MKSKKIKEGYIVRLEKREKIVETLLKFCEDNEIKTGHITGLGAVSEVELAHYSLENKEYSEKKITEPLEIINMTGNITEMDGKPYLHIHITIADKDMKTLGGHLKECIVSATCEIIITKVEEKIKRKFYDKIGLNLMDI